MDIKQRLLSNSLKVESGCIEWQGAKKGFGYGHMMTGSRKDGSRKTRSAHRVSYEEFKGEIPSGIWVLHKCDNPCCINPDHLYLGDRAQNVNDMIGRGRLNHNLGESCPNSVLSESDVLEIRDERMRNKTPYRKLASKYGLKSHKTISQICSGELWGHLPLPEPPKQEVGQ